MDVMRSKRGWEIIMPYAENQSLKAACRKIILGLEHEKAF
jgi:hypothetical protein